MIYYRAMPIESEGIRAGDYLTPSLEFAINHALTTSMYHSEDYGVFLVSLDKGEVKEAYNPGEWLYTGRGKKAGLIGIAKYNHRRNDSEYQRRSLRSLSGNNKTITTEGKMKKIAADRNYRIFKKTARMRTVSVSEGISMLEDLVNTIKNDAEIKSLTIYEDPNLRDDLGLAEEEFVIKIKADGDENPQWGPKEQVIRELTAWVKQTKRYATSKDHYMALAAYPHLFIPHGLEVILGRN